MKRKKFILGGLAILPLSLLGKVNTFIRSYSSKAFVVKKGEARFDEHFYMKGVTHNTLDIKISNKDTGGDLAVFEQIGLSPNGGPPLHIHLNQDEWFFILEGEYLFQVGEEKFKLKEGDTIFLPKNIPHAFIQLTQKARTIVSYLPAGKMEAFFAVTNNWDSPPSKEEISKVFEEHEMKIVGPKIILE